MRNGNLVENFFSKREGYESAILCTYSLNLNFFENYLLKQDALTQCDNICVFTDASTYDKFIVDVDDYCPRWLNTRYLISSIKTGGVFHSKLYMIASEKKVIVAIGSGNLTRESISSNLELLSFFEISEKNNTYSQLLKDCIDYVSSIAHYTKSKKSIEQVRNFEALCLKFISKVNENSKVRFIHNLEMPLIDQMIDVVNDSVVRKIQIISPFYDDKLRVLEKLKTFFHDTKIEFYLQQAKSTFPIEYFKEIKDAASLFIYKGIDRYIHGKAMIFYLNDRILVYTGSANFTDAALLTSKYQGNCEIGILGEINKEALDGIICPPDVSIEKVKSLQDIRVLKGEVFHDNSKHIINYIIEVLLVEDKIKLEVDIDLFKDMFKPEKIILITKEGKHEIAHDGTYVIDLKKYKGELNNVLAVQMRGCDQMGNTVETNISWVIRLEEKCDNSDKRRLRKVYSNPFELQGVLQELIDNGVEEELRRFLLSFDIPLDLLLPPGRFDINGRASKGNIEGALPERDMKFLFSKNMLQVYKNCIDRMYYKLESHWNNPQLIKINNFMLIISAMYSMISFINHNIYRQFKNKIVSIEDWSNIRDHYDLLLDYIEKSWVLFWCGDEYYGYRELVNEKIQSDDQDILGEDISTFEEYILNEYFDTFKELKRVSLLTIQGFEKLKGCIKVLTPGGKTVTPIVTQWDTHIIEIERIKNMVLDIRLKG